MKIKKIILLLFIPFIPLKGNTQMNNTSHFFILPTKTENKLCIFENNQIIEIRTISIPQNAKYVIDKSNIGACLYLNKIYIFQIISNDITYLPEIEVPNTLTPDCIAIKNGIIYVGGKEKNNSGELLFLYNIKIKEWKKITMPSTITVTSNKSIDDILIEKDILLAVDDLVFPKYLIEYNISDPSTPIFLRTYQLINTGAYEHITKGSSNEKYIALLSESSGHYQIKNSISIYSKKENYQNPFIWSTSKKQGRTESSLKEKKKKKKINTDSIPFYEWKDILLVDNALFIAAEKDGIGSFIFPDSIFNDSHAKDKFIQEQAEKNNDLIHYNKQKEGDVISLQAIPNHADFFVAIIQTNEGYMYKLLSTRFDAEKK